MEEKNLQQNEAIPTEAEESKNIVTENVPDTAEKETEPVEAGTEGAAEETSDVAADQTEAVEDKEQDPPEEVTEAPEEKTEAVLNAVPAEGLKEKACEKLRAEQKKANNKQFAEPVINYLLKRCEEDNGLAQDVMQEHKTWAKCFDYIYSQARKQAKNARSTAVRDDVVYEWAEDYYHKDDKAEEEKKAKEAAGRKKKAEENKKKAAEKKKTTKKPLEKKATKEAPKKEEKEAPKPAETKPKKNQKEMDGQMDLFSLMGM